MIEAFLSDFHFLHPWRLLLGLPLLLLVLWRVLRVRKANSQVGKGIIAEHLRPLLVTANKVKRNYWPMLVVSALIVILSVCLAQPVWQRSDQDPSKAAPLLVLMDMSGSMTQQDVKPSRYERGRFLIDHLLLQGVPRPVALIAVAGSSHTLLPPTVDMDLARLYLSYLSPDVMPADGGDLDDLQALIQQTPAYSQAGSDFVLVTDGLEKGLSDFKALVERREMEGVVVALSAAGQSTGNQLGVRTFSGESMSGTDNALSRAVFAMDSQPRGGDSNWQDESFWLILASAVLILLWFRKGWTLSWALCLVGGLVVFPVQSSKADTLDWLFSNDQQGMIYLYLGDYKRAAQKFENSGWRGVACYYGEDFKCAQDAFSKQGDLEAIFNMGNAAAQDGRYKTAAEFYRGVLGLNPNYTRAAHNLKIVEKIIKDINEFSASQKDDKPVKPPTNKETQKANEIADGGGQRQIIAQLPRATLKASQVLESQAATEKWLRDISKDPKKFVRAKFLHEYNLKKTRQNSTIVPSGEAQ
ncbi:vWA domain-containing protein [Polycladidibacter stylochi]|uniref:vWA domain-containing protein n=1 Tax=Polycladidibacter stylochi TaxID=1807766 RepID=UPI00082F8998|nr:VWA domain-containing protein [Pseudovibrio stylochi]